MRKVYIELTARVIINANDEADLDDVVSSLDMVCDKSLADIEDVEVSDWKVEDSK